MNIENFIKVRNAVANNNRFDMKHYAMLPNGRAPESPEQYKNPPCGTTFCIAGEAAVQACQEGYIMNSILEAVPLAIGYLGLTRSQAKYLFCGNWADKELEDITLGETLEYLDRCIEAKEIVIP